MKAQPVPSQMEGKHGRLHDATAEILRLGPEVDPQVVEPADLGRGRQPIRHGQRGRRGASRSGWRALFRNRCPGEARTFDLTWTRAFDRHPEPDRMETLGIASISGYLHYARIAHLGG